MANTAKTAKTGSRPIKKRRRMNRVYTMLFLLAAIAVMVVATLLMRGAWKSAVNGTGNTPATTGDDTSSVGVFGIEKVIVTGDTRYDPDAIIQASGLYVGQSVWSVDKKAAAENILATFPYVETAVVSNQSYSVLEIALTETEPIGAMYANGQWLVVGTNGKALETLPLEGDRPMRYLYFKGAVPLTGELGKPAMAERDFSIVQRLLAAFATYKLAGVGEIDLTNKSDITLNWNNRITIRLGGDGNLEHEIGVVVSALPGIEQQYGETAMGQLDVSGFSGADGSQRAVYTPAELLGGTTATTTAPDTATGSTTAPA